MTTTKKHYPAYGKILMGLRLAGEVPKSAVVVTFDWNIGRQFTRVVIGDDMPLESLELRFLAGCDVVIASREKDAPKLNKLIDAILAVNPRILQRLDLDDPKTTILKHSSSEVML